MCFVSVIGKSCCLKQHCSSHWDAWWLLRTKWWRWRWESKFGHSEFDTQQKVQSVSTVAQSYYAFKNWAVLWNSLTSVKPLHMTSEVTCSGELRTQKLKFHLLRTHSLKVLLLKPGVGQYIIAMHAMFTARNFFLFNFYPFGPFTCIFSKPLRSFFLVLAVFNTSSCVAPQKKIGHPAGCRFPCWAPAE